jgi:hypothetical protein
LISRHDLPNFSNRHRACEARERARSRRVRPGSSSVITSIRGIGRASRDGRHRGVRPDDNEGRPLCVLREAPWPCLLCTTNPANHRDARRISWDADNALIRRRFGQDRSQRSALRDARIFMLDRRDTPIMGRGCRSLARKQVFQYREAGRRHRGRGEGQYGASRSF